MRRVGGMEDHPHLHTADSDTWTDYYVVLHLFRASGESREAFAVGTDVRPPAVRVVASRAMGTLYAGLPPSKPYLVAPTAHVGGRGVYKLYGAHKKR